MVRVNCKTAVSFIVLLFGLILNGCIPIIQDNITPKTYAELPASWKTSSNMLLVIPVYEKHSVQGYWDSRKYWSEGPFIESIDALDNNLTRLDGSMTMVFTLIGTVHGSETKLSELCVISDHAKVASFRMPDRIRAKNSSATDTYHWREHEFGSLTIESKQELIQQFSTKQETPQINPKLKFVCQFMNGKTKIQWTDKTREKVVNFLQKVH